MDEIDVLQQIIKHTKQHTAKDNTEANQYKKTFRATTKKKMAERAKEVNEGKQVEPKNTGGEVVLSKETAIPENLEYRKHRSVRNSTDSIGYIAERLVALY